MNQPRKSTSILAALTATVILAACGGGSTPTRVSSAADSRKHALAIPPGSESIVSGATVLSLTQVSETRIGRTLFEYTFRVSVKNGPESYTGVTATLTAVGVGTSIVKGSVAAGDMLPDATVSPVDAIALRHDRTLPFDLNALAWEIKGTRPTPSAVPGILLVGSPDAAAESVLDDFIGQRSPNDLISETDADSGLPYMRSQLLAVIRQGASVAEVNAALNAVGARIVFMRKTGALVTIQVPPAASLAALRATAALLEASGAFTDVAPPMRVGPGAIPANTSPSDASTGCGPLTHHAAAGLPAAWNAAFTKVDTSTIEIIVIDYFGQTSNAGVSCGILRTKPASHGIHVENILLADFGGTPTLFGKVTGALPLALTKHRIDLDNIPLVFPNNNYVSELEWQILELERIFKSAPSKKFVINLSIWLLDPPCQTGQVSVAGTLCNDPLAVAAVGEHWRRLTRAAGKYLASKDYESQVVQVSIAGNGGKADARLASAQNAAVLTGNVPLTNGVIVENQDVSSSVGGDTPPTPACLHASSNVGGHIGAIGTDVLSATDPSSVGLMTGTSQAAPQVAGVVAYMLTVKPALSPSKVIQILRSNAKKDLCPGAAPMLDAYAALLALDESTGLASPSATTLPVRLAILDVANQDSIFSIDDFKLFVDAYFPLSPSQIPGPTYSRFDLNGDGFDGGAGKTARFNLDLDYASDGANKYSVSPTRPKTSLDLRRKSGDPLDENALTDFEILCYYVNTNLFQGTQAEIADALAAKSLQLGRSISCALPSAVLLRVETTNPGWSGLPASIDLSGIAQTSIGSFQVFGSPGNTCGTGERGSPLYSSFVDPSAAFHSVTLVAGLPHNDSGPFVNRRPCSSFYALRSFGSGFPDQVWINATGRGVQFSQFTTRDWEVQIRYSNGDLLGVGKQCEVGNVANAGFYSKHFDAVCRHFTDIARVMD